MNRGRGYLALAAAALLVLFGIYAMTRLERVPVEKWSPPGKEARRNPQLALERFMAAMGRPLVRAGQAAFLDSLPAGGVLILDNHRRAYMSPARVERLLNWVRDGGYLVVAAENPGVDDPVLAHFQVNCGCKPDPDQAPPPAAKKPAAPKHIAVAIPGAARPLTVDYVFAGLAPGKTLPEWRAGAPGHPDQILHFRHGSGHVTMIAGFSRLFDNHSIGRNDHAELLWTLVETYQPEHGRPVTLVSRLAAPGLWEWLAESAAPALVAAAVLIFLWLWRIVPRFGPVRPEPEPGRRELGEHLAAIGRFVWRAAGCEPWLAVARESFKSRLALRHPALLELAPAEQAQALARLTRRPAALIAAALHEPVRSPQSFTLAMRTLRNLERTL